MSEVYVGNKPVMNYALAVMAQFNGGAEEVAVKARGRAISKAVDVAEVVRRRFLKDVDIKDIQISTDRVENERGPANVSAIEIVLTRK